MIVLSTLGSAAIDIDDRRITPTAERTFAVVLYLAVERGRPVPRSVLQELLFPEATVRNGSHSLRQLLYQLRKWGVEVGTDPTHACLAPEGVRDPVADLGVALDINAETLRAIAGGYIPGYLPSFSESFTEWLDGHRRSATSFLLRCLSGHLTAAKAAHDWARTERVARACLALDSLHEEATLALAENLALAGAKSEAVGMLDRLMIDLGPSTTPLTLPATLLRRRISERVPDAYGKRESPLVDREEELRAIGRFLDPADEAGPIMLMLIGDPGIGKTRLMERSERMAGITGTATVRIAVQPHHIRRPLSLFSDIVPQLVRLPGAIGCSPESLQYLRVLQQGTTEHIDPAARETDAEAQFARVLRAIDDILDAITSETRLLVIVEDAHDLDSLSARVLTTITARRGSRRLLVAATFRPNSDAADVLRRNERSMVIPLGPLSPSASADLIKQLLLLHHAIADDTLTEWWVSVAAGNPLFLTMLVVHHARTGARFAIPPNLNQLLLKRLEGLKDSSVLLFEACAVLGENATVPHIEYCTGLSVHELHSAMRELEGCGLIAVSGQLVQPVHRLLTDAALSAAPSSVRMLLHRRAAEALERRAGHGAHAQPWSAAEHWASTGDEERVAASLQSCAEQLLAIGRPSEACDLFSQAANQLESATANREMLMAAMLAAEAAGRWGTVDTLLKQLKLGQEEPLPGDETGTHFYILAMEAAAVSGHDISGHTNSLRRVAEDVAIPVRTRLGAAKLLVVLADHVWDLPLAASAWASSQSLTPTCREDEERQLAIAMIYHVAFGNPDEGQRTARRLLAAMDRRQHHPRLNALLRNAARALHHTGATQEALSLLETFASDLAQRRLFASAFNVAAHRAEICLDIGDTDQARSIQATADQLAVEAVDKSFTSGASSNRIRLALADGNLDAAETLLRSIENLPGLNFGRHKWIAEAYRMRIDRLRGRPCTRDADALLEAHRLGRATSDHDDIVVELFYCLSSAGQRDLGRQVIMDYVHEHRRDAYPMSQDLREIVEAGR